MSQEISAQDLYPLQDRLEVLDAKSDLDYDEKVEADHLRDQVWSAQDSFGGVVYRIPEPRIEELEKKIGKMIKRAEKLGINPPTLTDTGEREVITENDEQQEWAYVVVGGQPPVLGGWTFLATLQHEEAGTIVRRIPNPKVAAFADREEIIAKLDLSNYREAKPVCDHCNTRRVRRDTYLVLHETGETKQVGSNCLQDFTGGLNPQQAAKGFEYITKSFDEARKIQGMGFSGLTPELLYDTEEFMAHTALTIRENGWVSRAKSEEWGKTSTSSLARSNLDRKLGRYVSYGSYPWREDVPEWDEPTQEDIEFAKAALDHARNLPGDSDYEHNLKVALAGDHIKVRSAGIVASAVGIYKMKLERENPTPKAPRLDEHFGEVKERLTLTLTVKKAWSNVSDFGGMYHTYIMTDAEGRSFKGTSSNVELEEGETYTGKWTVKRHETHERFGKQTILNRLKLEEKN